MASVIAPGSQGQELVNDYSWAREHYEVCADRLLGSHEDLVGRPFSVTIVATVRVFADACGERQVSLVAKASDGLEVHAVRVKGEPILEQLLALHESAPADDARQLCESIPVESALVTGAQAKGFSSFLEELGKHDFSLLPEHIAVLHGAVYSVWITSGQWTVHFSFRDTRDPLTRHRMAIWAEGVLATADLRCDSARAMLNEGE